MQSIDENSLAQGDVPRSVSIDFYKMIETQCRERRQQIQLEMDNDES